MQDLYVSAARLRPTDRICAIHQPNFFPWQGYFDKIRRADVFIFLDDVAYPKSGSGMGSWTNRVKISSRGIPMWFGCPISRYSGMKRISEVVFAENSWREKSIKTLRANYARHPNFKNTMELIEPLIRFECGYLVEFNINAIKRISSYLELDIEFVRQSELEVGGTSTELLCNLVKAVSADAYLCGGGADGYQDDVMFEEAGLQLIYQCFSEIPHSKPFVPGLSIIDFLMTRSPGQLFRS